MKLFPLVLKASFVTSVAMVSVQAEETKIGSSTDVGVEAELDNITVNANVFGKSANQVAQPVTILTDEELERQRAGSLGETLGLQSGINNSSYGAAVGRPVIRGLGGARVKILQGGIDTMDASAVSPDHGVNVDTHSATQIEVLRGPATLRYGSGAFGGVVNVIDNRIPNGESRDELDPNTEIKVGYDSVNQGKTLGLKNAGQMNDFHWAFSANTFSSDEYNIPDLKEHSDHEDGDEEEHEEHSDVLANSDISKRNNFTLGTSYVFESGFAGIAISRSESEFGLPGHAHHDEDAEHSEEEHEEEEEGARIDMVQTRIDIDSRFDQPFAGSEHIKVQFGMNDYAHDEIEDGAVGTQFKRKGYEGRAELLLEPMLNITHAVGIQVAQDTYEAIGDEAIVPVTDSQTAGIFWLGETTLDQWTLEVGARAEQTQRSPDQPSAISTSCSDTGLDLADYDDQSYQNNSLSFGATRSLFNSPESGWQLRGSITTASRAPATEELFSCGAHAATQTFDIGNPNLGSEQAFNIDLGIEKVRGDLTAAINVYRNNINDFIYAQNSGLVVDDFDQYQYVQQDASFVGGEIDLAYQLGRGWALTAMADGVRGTLDSADASGDDQLPRMPADRIGLGVEVSGTNFFHGASNWTLYSQIIQVQKQDQVALNEEATDGYSLLSAGISYHTMLASSEYSIDLKGTNLLDSEIRQHTSFVKELAPQPGRGISLGLTANF
jgi:iron complex outermembrane receptor protein